MLSTSLILGLTLLAQVPPPAIGPAARDDLKACREAILKREAKELEALAQRLERRGGSDEAAAVRRLFATAGAHHGVSSLAPLPQVVPGRGEGLASIAGKPSEKTALFGRQELEQARSRAASELYALAKRAAATNPPHITQTALCLRAILERTPDHPEARRLTGYVPYNGGWARPFAVRQLKAGNVDHPVFGWVPADWVVHLDRGELPAPASRGQKQVRWLPARQADSLRASLQNPWQIATEHFEIQADVPLGEAVEFARRLEAFYDLFFTLMADVVGENLPLARRLRSAALSGEGSYRTHQVWYFASDEEYVKHLTPLAGAGISGSLGYYNPPRPGKGSRSVAYFFRDQGGQLPVTATLYHEVSHQLLFETAGPNAYTKNAGNYWVFEGLGTYFETVTPRLDGTLEFGGLAGPRMAAARRMLGAGKFVPLDQFLQLDQNAFNRDERIRENYQQAMALAVFLMQWDGAVYRDAFLDYVRDAYRGRIKRSTGRSLEDRVGKPLPVLEGQLRAFLAAGEGLP
ncbi:MAG: DUF1570 domain-containing protein [Isosphaeraceae bacterium]